MLEAVDWSSFSGVKHIHGFNYQPSWGHDAVSVWLDKFDAARYRQELQTGKRYFPGFNCVRIWLGYGAYRKNPKQLLRNFNAAVAICEEHELLVIPVLFSIWAGVPPFDPIAVADLVGGNFEKDYGAYLRDIVGSQHGNKSILAWDLCNEPTEGNPLNPETRAQALWLKFLHDRVKSIDPQARTCIGTVTDLGWGQSVAEYCDLLTPHLYGYSTWKPAFDARQTRSSFLEWFDSMVDQYMVRTTLLNKVPKPILSTETCWGAVDDMERQHIIEDTLAVLKRRGIGFLPHALHTSGVADLHVPEKYQRIVMGVIVNPATMAFINSDGSLRPRHEVFNEYCG